jgi:hypothetical protein
LLTRRLEQAATIGYLACEYSPIHEKMIRIPCDEVPKGEVYFIKPASLGIDLGIEHLSSLDGTHQNIPLKNVTSRIACLMIRQTRSAPLGPADAAGTQKDPFSRQNLVLNEN